MTQRFSKDVLQLDLEQTASQLSDSLRDVVLHSLRRRGVVVAISGGIDSACVAALINVNKRSVRMLRVTGRVSLKAFRRPPRV